MIEIKTNPDWEFKDRFKILHIITKNRYSTYKDLGKALDISVNTIFKYINGKAEPGLQVLIKIKTVFPEVNLNWLIAGNGEMYV